MEPTVNSWGGSGLVPAPKRRGPLLAIAGVAAVFAAAGGLWAARSSSTPESKAPAPATSPSVEVAKTDVKAPVLAPAPEVTGAPDVAATSPSGSADLAGMPASPVSALPATNGKAKAALVASGKTATKKTEPKRPDIAPPPAAKPGGVTDFGGRR